MQRLAGVLLALLLLLAGSAAEAGPTDIAAVDEYIDAPRALFGRTRAECEERLGPPASERQRADGVALSWPGLDIVLSRSARIAGVVVRAAGRPLPHGLDIGASRARVQAVLGDALDTADEHAVYRDSDGFPNSVEFFFRSGRVTRIEWRFWAG
jgi:hypothetical protein